MNKIRTLRIAMLCMASMLFFCFSVNAQVVAGIKANGKIMVHGDTINVCRGSSILYQSVTEGSLNITWRFRGGLPANGSGAGSFTVVYNTNGFDTTFQKVTGGGFADSMFIIVRVSNVAPVAAFNFSPDNVCGNENIVFSNTSSTGNPLTYQWDFNDGTGTTAKDPSHQFLTAIGLPGVQQFAVKLITTNANACKDTITKTVTIKKVPDASLGNADGSVIFGPFNGNPTFKKCSNIPSYTFKFLNKSTTIASNVSYKIQWGDGKPDSTFTNWPATTIIEHTFPLGSSTMTVNVTGPDGCIGIKKYIVFIGTIPAGGLASLGNTDICSSDSLRFAITNTANNPPGTSYSFFINDGSAGQVFQHEPPSIVGHYFTTGSCSFSSNNGVQNYFNAFGAYLTIENPCGSNSASVVPIYVSGKPRPSIYIPSPVVCVNKNVTVYNTSSFGNVVTPTGTFSSSCENSGKKVWSITPATGYTISAGSMGALNGSPTNSLLWTDGSNTLDLRFTTPGIYQIKIYIGNDRCGTNSTIQTICVRNAPAASFIMSKQTGCGATTINLTNTSPAGGCQGDEYRWDVFYSDPENCAPAGGATWSFANGTTATSDAPSLTFNKIGRYIVRLTTSAINSYGCGDAVARDTFFVTGPPKATLSGVTAICINNKITPKATLISCYSGGKIGYRWSFTNGIPATSTTILPGDISYATAGVHAIRLIVTDSSCMLSDTINTTVNVASLPAANAGNAITICSGEMVSLGAAGIAGVTYQWSPATGLSNSAIANPAATLSYNGPANDTVYKYYLTVSMGANCSSIDSVEVTVKRKPVVVVNPITSQICFGTSTTLTASGADDYSWSPAVGLNNTRTAIVTASPTNTTNYTVIGKLANGCTDQKTVNVTVIDEVKAVAGNDATVCSGETVSLGTIPVNGVSYQWSPATGLGNSAIANPIASLTYNGLAYDTVYKYYLTASVNNGTCSSIDSVEITVKRKPAVLTDPVATQICFGTSTTLTASGAETYSWSPSAGLNNASTAIVTASPTNTIIYTVIGKLANGCTDQKMVNVTVVPEAKAVAGDDVIVCSGETVSLGIAPVAGVSYQWSPATGLSNSAIANPVASLTYNGPAYDTGYKYYLTASINGTCSTIDSVEITINRKPVVTLTPASVKICIGSVTLLTAGGADSYLWSPAAGLNKSTGDEVQASPVATTEYTVKGSLTNGCYDEKKTVVNVFPHTKAEFLAPDTVKCSPLNINNLITVIPFAEGNSTYNWSANDVLIGSNTTGVVPSYIITQPGQAVMIKLVTVSAEGCKADSIQKTFRAIPSVTAAFTKDKDSSCAPLNVSFTNTSSSLAGIDFIWDFGNGKTSTDVQPGPITFNANPFFRDTIYHILLKATNGCDTNYYRDSVKVFANIKARFGVDTTRGCSPFTIVISNNSQGNGISYYWDFGDGKTDTTHSLGSFEHTYNTGTISTYTLRLIAENRCERDTQQINIVVSPNEIKPFIAAYGDQLKGCAPHTVIFNNSSVGASEITWNFGDNTAPLITPNSQGSVSHQYANAGNYKVIIGLRNDCSDTTIERTVIVYDSPVARFEAAPTRICAEQTIAVNNTSLHANSYEWFWDDGSASSFVNGQHRYNDAGVYNIMLVAQRVHPAGFVCTDTMIKQVTVVNKVLAQINVEPGKTCVPYTLKVSTDNAINASRIEWIIYDSSAVQGEFHTDGPSATQVFNNEGSYSVKLVVHTATGCTDTATHQFNVFNTPHTEFEPELIKTCEHDTTVNFTAITTQAGNDPVNYKWFVNESIEGTTNPFSYRFQAPLNNELPVVFTIKAIAQNAAGCGDTSVEAKVIIQPLPIPSITVNPSVVLQQPDYLFTFKDNAATNPDKNYLWDLGDRSLQTREGQQITYQYGDTGTYNVKLLVKDFSTGCTARDSVTVSILYVPGYLQVPNGMCPGCSNFSLRQFLPLGKGLKKYRLSIFNLWGQKLFETTSLNPDGSPNVPWDGTYMGKPIQQDAYIWQIEAIYKNETEWKGMIYPGTNKPVKTGFITVIK